MIMISIDEIIIGELLVGWLKMGSFWVGAALNILARCESSADTPGEIASLHHGLDAAPAARFVLSCQKETGGFGKWGPGQGAADPLHTFFSLAGLQLLGHDELPHAVSAELGMRKDRTGR